MLTARKVHLILIRTIICMLPFNYIAAQSNPKPTLSAIKAEIATCNETYFRAFSKKDPSLFTGLYLQDSWIMPPGMPALCGPDAAGDYFDTAYNELGIRNGKFISVDIYGIASDMVAEVGFWKIYNASQIEFDDGKFLVLWKRTANGWKRWRDSFSSSRSKN